MSWVSSYVRRNILAKEVGKSLIRHAMSAAGMWLAAKGLGDAHTVEIIVGGITAVVGVVAGALNADSKTELKLRAGDVPQAFVSKE